MKLLRSLPLFQCFSKPETKVLVSDVFLPRYFEPGDLLFQEVCQPGLQPCRACTHASTPYRQGEPCRHFYVLLEGRVKLQVANPELRDSQRAHNAFREQEVWRDDDPHWMVASRAPDITDVRHVSHDGRVDTAASDDEPEYADDLGEDPHQAAIRKRVRAGLSCAFDRDGGVLRIADGRTFPPFAEQNPQGKEAKSTALFGPGGNHRGSGAEKGENGATTGVGSGSSETERVPR